MGEGKSGVHAVEMDVLCYLCSVGFDYGMLVVPLCYIRLQLADNRQIRIIFRMVEYSNGVSSTSPILRYEVYQYVLDLAPMFLAFLLLNIFHPGRVLTGPESEFPRLSRAEKKKLKQERKAEKAARKADKKAGRRTELKPLQATPGEVSDADSFDSLRDQEEAGMQPAPQRGESPPRYYRVSNSFDVLNTQYEAPR